MSSPHDAASPNGRKQQTGRTDRADLRCGGWPAPHSLEPGGREETLAVLDGGLADLYLSVDADGRLR